MSTLRPVLGSTQRGSLAGPTEFTAYTEDISSLFKWLRYNLYADDMQAYSEVSVAMIKLELSCRNASALLTDGFSCWLQLLVNDGKTEFIWIGSMSANALKQEVSIDTIHPATTVPDLGR